MSRQILFLVATSTTLLLLFSTSSFAAPNCGDIIQYLTPCLPTLSEGTPPVPSTACCNGVTFLAGASGSRADRIQICQCIVSILPSLPSINETLITTLPSQCGIVNLQLPSLSPTYHCSAMH